MLTIFRKLKRIEESMSKQYAFLGFFLSATVLCLIVGFTVIGSPWEQRLLALDQKRLSHFSSLSYQIEDYFRTNRKLPETLSNLPNTNPDMFTDPQSKKQYDYKIIDDASYNLCTTFSKDSSKDNNEDGSLRLSEGRKVHKEGYDCIKYTVPDFILESSSYNLVPTPTSQITYCPWINSGKNVLYTGTFVTYNKEKTQFDMINQDGQTISFNSTNAKFYNKTCLETQIENFAANDSIRVEASGDKQAAQAQNTSR